MRSGRSEPRSSAAAATPVHASSANYLAAAVAVAGGGGGGTTAAALSIAKAQSDADAFAGVEAATPSSPGLLVSNGGFPRVSNPNLVRQISIPESEHEPTGQDTGAHDDAEHAIETKTAGTTAPTTTMTLATVV